MTRKFDLNIEKILENWETPDAIREIIANAIDEQKLSGTQKIEIFKDENNRWHIRDYGRGLRYEHFTQKENEEKLNSPGIVGRFGIGLKDALATFDRRNVQVLLRSKHGDITIGKSVKQDFGDLFTLHAYISEPQDPKFIGTDVIMTNVEDQDIYKAKSKFLQFSNGTSIEDTLYGQVLSNIGTQSSIFINGVKVAEEENFLFSYNITSLTAAIKKALNRERNNVGRSAYAERVKAILLCCSKWEIADALMRDLKDFGVGRKHDELNWIDVQQHAATILSKVENVVFVTPKEIEKAADVVQEAKATGHTLVVIPEVLREKVTGTTTESTALVTPKEIERDPSLLESLKENRQTVIIVPEVIKERAQQIEKVSGVEVRDFSQYVIRRNENFEFSLVDPMQLRKQEHEIFQLKNQIFSLIGGKPPAIREVVISETMQRDNYTYLPADGVWQPAEGRIVVKRSTLQSKEEFIATLVHEIAHAKSNAPDASRAFETELTNLVGLIGSRALENRR